VSAKAGVVTAPWIEVRAYVTEKVNLAEEPAIVDDDRQAVEQAR
jgi:hypothetical protein